MRNVNLPRTVGIVGLSLSLGLLVWGCPPNGTPNGNAGNENDNGTASSLIFPENYAATFTEVRDCRISIDNHPENVRVLVNEVGAQAYLNDDNPLPVGTIIVKEIYDGVGCGDDADLIGLTAMVKMEAGFDSEDNDWRWQEVARPSNEILFNEKTTCVACHSVLPECVGRDYICTEE